MSAKTILLALLTVALNGGAQLFLRGAALRGATPSQPTTLLQSPLFFSALIAYAASVLTWLLVLKAVPLSSAMPFNALIYVLVPIASVAFFGDQISARSAFGMVLVVAGVLVVAKK